MLSALLISQVYNFLGYSQISGLRCPSENNLKNGFEMYFDCKFQDSDFNLVLPIITLQATMNIGYLAFYVKWLGTLESLPS